MAAVGNVGQAQSWAATRVALTSASEVQVVATAKLLGTGVPYVSGPDAPPIGALPNLWAGPLGRLQRSHLLPDTPVSAYDLINARTALAVGTWNGSVTALTRHPLSTGRFRYEKSTFSAPSSQPGGCLGLTPVSTDPVQIWLRLAPGEGSASLRVISPPAVTGTVNYLAAVLVPPRGPTTSVPLELVVPHKGKGYLSDDDPQAELVITWNEGTPLTLCGLSAPYSADVPSRRPDGTRPPTRASNAGSAGRPAFSRQPGGRRRRRPWSPGATPWAPHCWPL